LIIGPHAGTEHFELISSVPINSKILKALQISSILLAYPH
jgi:hypothetical protein